MKPYLALIGLVLFAAALTVGLAAAIAGTLTPQSVAVAGAVSVALALGARLALRR